MKIKKKTKNVIKFSIAGVILLIEIVMVIVLVSNSAKGVRGDSPVHSVLTVEAGSDFDISSFLRDETLTCEADEKSRYDVSVPGDYKLTLLISDGTSHEVTLKVRDTTPPTYKEMPTLIVKRGAALQADMLMPAEYIKDATNVKVSFLGSSVSTNREGHFTALLRLVDSGGNITKVTASYFVTENYNEGYYYEIGGPMPQPKDILPESAVESWMSKDFTPKQPQRVTVFLTMYGKEYFLHYEAKDTQAPSVKLREGPFVFEVGRELPDPLDFIESVIDNTPVTVSYDQEYLLDKPEQKKINIIVKDAAGNATTVSAYISVVESGGEDTAAPRIIGTKDLTTELGVRPDYLAGVSVYDARDGVILNENLHVDDSAVNYMRPSPDAGYEVIYSVRDKAGNEARTTIRVRVVQNVLPDEELDIYIKQIVSELGDLEGLTRFEVISKVYDLLTGKYLLEEGNAHTDLSDLRKEAYWGFRMKKGSHETACAMVSALLEKLNIQTKTVRRAALGSSGHSWVMADYGVGWLYIDTLPTYGYVWTKDGRLLRESSAEAKALTEADVLRREAMTAEDVEALTALSNKQTVGWNYYKADLTGYPETAKRAADGSYISPSYTLKYTVNSAVYGSISGLKEQNVIHGGSGSAVTAVAAKGYKFVSWSDGFTEATRSDTVTGNLTLQAEFAPDSQTFRYYPILYEAEEGGSIRGEAKQNVLYDNYTTEVTAVPDERHYFVSWSDGGTAPTRRDLVKSGAVYTARFQKKLTLLYTAGEGGRIIGDAEQYLIPGSSGSFVRAAPADGYEFYCWSDGVTTPERKDSPSADFAVEAVFLKDESSYTVRYTAGEGGHIEGEIIQTAAAGERGTTVRAVADEGYVFVAWSDGNVNPERTDLIVADHEYTAVFRSEDAQTFTVTYTAAEGGQIFGEAVQTVMSGMRTGQVVAVADEGYVFVGWSDGLTSEARSDAAEEDLLLVALFEKIGEE